MSDLEIQKTLASQYSSTLKEFNFPDTISSHALISDYLSYLGIKIVFLEFRNQPVVTPPKKIDELWEKHILHTLNYNQFNTWCSSRIPNFSFIHHHPGEVSKNPSEIIEFYQLVYGKPPNPEIWNFNQLQKPHLDYDSDFGCG